MKIIHSPLDAEAASRLQNQHKPRILVVGDLMLDSRIEGSAARISPEAPVPVLNNPTETGYSLGGAGNVAANLQALGAQVRLIAGIGSAEEEVDTAGKRLLWAMDKAKLDSSGIVKLSRITTEKRRISSAGQQLLRFDYEDSTELNSEEESLAISMFDKALDGVQLIVLADYEKGFLSTGLLKHISETARSLSIKLIADVRADAASSLSYATMIKCNARRALAISRKTISGKRARKTVSEIGESAADIAERFGCASIVTCGADGVIVCEPNEQAVCVAPKALEAFDRSGAGDTSLAALALATASGLTPVQGAQLANTASGIAVSRHGIVVVERSELEAEIHKTIVPKTWGHEEWIVNSEYCGKKLVLRKGFLLLAALPQDQG